ncbi:hypothetical protein TorRG33x02_149500, partial [Trema orientale]
RHAQTQVQPQKGPLDPDRHMADALRSFKKSYPPTFGGIINLVEVDKWMVGIQRKFNAQVIPKEYPYTTFANLVAQTTKAEVDLEKNHRAYKKKKEKKDGKAPQPGKSSGTSEGSAGKSRFTPYSTKCFLCLGRAYEEVLSKLSVVR